MYRNCHSLLIFGKTLLFSLFFYLSSHLSSFDWFVLWLYNSIIPGSIYLFKFNNRNSRTRYEICSKLTIKTPERRHWRCCLYVNFKYIVLLLLVFLSLPFITYVIAGWDNSFNFIVIFKLANFISWNNVPKSYYLQNFMITLLNVFIILMNHGSNE